ncbi:MAG: hypothetical protein OEO21_06740 [Candidatus Krumholzibacteria bacterium]|nr:hypothetical protein [Candidatus Krumholzibacteria bacterium]
MRNISEQQEQPSFRLNIGEYSRLLWRKKYFLIVPLVIAVAVTSVGTRFLVPEYESSTVIRMEQESSGTRELARFLDDGGRRRSADAEAIARLEADLAGSAFLDELIRHLGMDRDPALIAAADAERRDLYPSLSTEELVYRRLRNFLKRRIFVDREGPWLFRVTYADANPEACFVIAEAVTNLYIDQQRRHALEDLRHVGDFSEEQVAVYKERLERSERALESFQERMAQYTLEANPINAGNVGTAEALRRELDLNIEHTESALGTIRSRLVALLGRVPDGGAVTRSAEFRRLDGALGSRLETALLAELGGGAPAAQRNAPDGSVRDAIVETEQQLQRYLTGAVLTEMPQVPADYRPLVAEYFFQQVELEALQQKRDALNAFITAFRNRVALEPQMNAELERLRQEVEQNRTLYNTFLSSRTSTQISEAVESTDLGASIVVVEAAGKPLFPVRPNKAKILVMAVVLGLMVGGSGLLITEFTDTSFRSVDEVERELGMKVLGTVPRFEKGGKFTAEGSRRRAAAWIVVSVVVIAGSLIGFYLYGKSSRAQMIDLDLGRTTQADRG